MKQMIPKKTIKNNLFSTTLRMKKLFFLIIAIFWFQCTQAQQRCGHVEYMNHLYKKNPQLKKEQALFNAKVNAKMAALKQLKIAKIAVTEEIYEIPVVVHVIYNNAAGGITNISDAQIYSQIDILNKDYSRTNADTNLTYGIYKTVAANTGIHFCLAQVDPNGGATNGIVRVYSDKTTFPIYDEASIKKLSYWPSDHYLNLWVCNLESPYLGYAQFPNFTGLSGLDANNGGQNTDGVVIDYKAFGTGGTSTYPYNMGRTTTHEVGHWLGLLHTWGDNYCGDDYVSDTPPQDDYNSGDQCDTSYSYCLGPETIDMLQNYMDYSADACMNIFTEGQKDRMRAVMDISPTRKSLFESFGCCAPEYTVLLPQTIDFENTAYLDEQWKVLNFDASSMYSKNWTQVSPGAFGESNYSFKIENDSVYSSDDTSYWDVLESPVMDLSLAETPMLDFDLAYALRASSTQTDSLVLYYNLGCKDKWIVAKTWYGEDLMTTSRQMDDFLPGVEDWEKQSVNLNFLTGKKRVKFRLAVYSKGANNLYLDNINFYKASRQFRMNVFPLPAENELNLEVMFTGYKDVTIEMFNTLGKKLLTRERQNTTSFIETINLLDISGGIYIFRIISDGEELTRRVMVR